MSIPFEQRICEAHPGGGISKTVPDMTLSLRTLVERYVQRREVPHAPDAAYLSEDSILNDFYPENMDIEERLEFADAIAHAVADETSKRKKPAPAPAPEPEPIRDDIAGV